MILPLLLLFTTALAAEETPLLQLIQEVIYQTNKANLQNHRDVLKISGFKYNDFVTLEVGQISASNFSTIALVGNPEMKQVEKEDGTSYYFDIGVGLEVLKLDFDYKFNSPVFSTSGTIIVKNTGNGIKTRVVVNTFNGKKPCSSVLEAVEVESLGNLDLEFGKSGVLNWILGRLIKFAYGMGESYVRPMINQLIADQVKAQEFQTLFSQLACTPFNI